jgi:hypothetical protein
MAPSPMVTPGTTVTPAAIHTFGRLSPAPDHVGPPVRIDVVVQRSQRAAVPDERPVSDGDASGVLERQPMLMKTPSPRSRFLPNSQ